MANKSAFAEPKKDGGEDMEIEVESDGVQFHLPCDRYGMKLDHETARRMATFILENTPAT